MCREGEYYSFHFDSDDEVKRLVTCLIYLNNVEEGGSTIFPLIGARDSALPPRIDPRRLELDPRGELEKYCNSSTALQITPSAGKALFFSSYAPAATRVTVRAQAPQRLRSSRSPPRLNAHALHPPSRPARCRPAVQSRRRRSMAPAPSSAVRSGWPKGGFGPTLLPEHRAPGSRHEERRRGSGTRDSSRRAPGDLLAKGVYTRRAAGASSELACTATWVLGTLSRRVQAGSRAEGKVGGASLSR